MTNPNNAVGANAGLNGRTTPNALNDVLSIFTGAGVASGWACSPKSGMTVQIGGGSSRDVAIAEDNAGNRIAINNRSGSAISVTIPSASATSNRIDSIVAYANNPITGAGASDVDFPSQVGLIVVSGTASANPSQPTDAQINSAITADGGTGVTAYRVRLANIYVGQGVTTIGSGVITNGAKAIIDSNISQAGQAASALRAEIVATRTTLFEGSRQGDTTLSDNWANYDKVEVTFATNSAGTQSVTQTFPGTCTDFTLSAAVAGGSNTVYLGYTRFTVSGATMTRGNYYQKSIAASAVTTQSQDNAHILKVVGIKYIA